MSSEREPDGAMARVRSAGRVLAHPLVLLLVGAAISSVLVPALTRQSQRNEQSLEITRDLAERMSAAVSPFIAASLSNFLLWRGKIPAEYDHAYERWSTDSDVILTRMRTYLDDSRIADAWQELQYAMRQLYEFFKAAATPEQSRRFVLERRLHGFLARACGGSRCLDAHDVDTLAQFYVPPKGINPDLDRSLTAFLRAYRLANEAIIERVLEADVRL